MIDPSDLNSLGRGSNSDKPGRRYFSRKGPVKPILNYDLPLSIEDKEEISSLFEQKTTCGTAIPINKAGVTEYAMLSPRDKLAQNILEENLGETYPENIQELLSDSGMHLLSSVEEVSDLEKNDPLL